MGLKKLEAKTHKVMAALLIYGIAFGGVAFNVPIAGAADESDAEVGTNPQEEQAESSFVLDSVVVTARRRAELQNEVPVSITTITQQEIASTGLEDMSTVIMMTPGLNGLMSPQSTSSSFNIRGIGTLGTASGWEDGSISAYIDGVPIPISQLDNSLLDIEQIEVLRGPQGTLFGKTAQGGAINITTKAPESTFGARIGSTVGTLGRHGVDAMATGPLIKDKLNARLFVDAQAWDGNVKNKATGDPLGDVQRYYTRGSLEGFWTDSFTTRLNLSYEKWDNEDNITVPMSDYDRTNVSISPHEKRDTFSAGLINKLDFTDNFRLNLVTGFSRIEFDTLTETTTALTPLVKDTEYHVNQEIRFEGEVSALEWTAGLYGSYYKREIDHSGISRNALMQFSYADNGEQTANTLAAFAEGTYSLTEKWKFTLGGRLNRDERKVDETVHFDWSPFISFDHTMNESKTHTDWNGRAIISFLPTDNHTIFASVSRGYKPGGYQTYHNVPMYGTAENTPGFDESTSWAYELGYKGLFLDRRLGLDVSAFFNDTEGECILGYAADNSSIFYNLDTYSYGLEIASRLRATEALSLGANIAITRAELREDKVLIANLGQDAVSKGDTLPTVPRFSSYIFSEYRQNITKDIAGFVRADFNWRSTTYLDITHYAKNGGYGLLNMRLGLESDKYSVILYGDNLTDKEYITYALGNFQGVAVYPARGREIGVKLAAYF